MKPDPLTIGQFLKYLVPSYVGKKRFRCPDWPADLFAIAAALLEKSGGYTLLGTDFCNYETSGFSNKEDRGDGITSLAEDWRDAISVQLKRQSSQLTPEESRIPWFEEIQIPTTIVEWWQELRRCRRDTVASIRSNRVVLGALINLLAVSDEALSRVGFLIHGGGKIAPGQRRFWDYCGSLLVANSTDGSTLCREILPSRIRVLPKSQMPVGGLSLRSLSHYLAMCPPIDIPAFWYSRDFLPEAVADDHCNILVVPWPLEILPNQFQPFEIMRELSDPGARRFTFSHTDCKTQTQVLCDQIEKMLVDAMRQTGPIHMVVLPELSLTRYQYDELWSRLCKTKVILIAGVSEKLQPDGPEGKAKPRNVATTTVPAMNRDGYVQYHQQKHHRWKLDASQVVRYGLASQLNPQFVWWEGIELDDRHINFMRPKPWLSLCVLLCEDLAQFDPVGRFVRAVAPDLVIALLMDGPQLASRWPARYATVLADDPGSSVLTLTSLGMSALSRLPKDTAKDVPRTIALWKDPVEGMVQIDLPKGKTAAIITVRNNDDDRDVLKYTADGRSNADKFGTPTFGGVQFV